MCKRGFTRVVRILVMVRHINICLFISEVDIIFVDGKLHGFIDDLLRNIYGYRAGELELFSLKYVYGVHTEVWL